MAAEDAGNGARQLAGCSFTADTKVLLASGAAVPISKLKAGDKVRATNTKAGKTRAQSVAAVLVNHDTNLYDLTIRTHSGSAVIHTTSNHPFFDLTRHRWVKAAALEHGDRLRSSDGTIVTVSGGRTPKVTTGWMWDLTVPGGNDHDFYIQAATTAILVHNCGVPSARFVGNADGTVTDTTTTRFTVGSDGTIVDRLGLGSTMSSKMSLGRYPTYLDYGSITGARTFNVGEYWGEMAARADKFGGTGPGSEVWIRNASFLDRGYDPILTANPADPANVGSFFMREVEYLFGGS